MLNTNVGSHSKQDPILHCSCSAAYCDEFLTQAPLSQCFKIDTTQQQYTETELSDGFSSESPLNANSLPSNVREQREGDLLV